ncbi:MAG: ATP-binding protein, partial [Desulforhopalus sp.]
RHNIERGQVGMVMIGIDETENLATDQQLHMLTARWEKIFIAIQDPALVVSNDNIILEANPATCSASRKRRDQVIGSTVCDILHGGHGDNTPCPLEQFIGYQKTQISETELLGLHGLYMLTVTPLIEENGEINATLLLARNLTEEEVVRAEAVRVAQLAAIGELASGIAHEINNPINGIINYARIILDDPNDPEVGDNLLSIIGEGKRIAGIVSSLLDFARRREEALAPAHICKIVTSSLQLVNHLLKKDGISCSVDIDPSIPELVCNEQQLQQVVLNMISNSRYALNKRYPEPCPEKKIEIDGSIHKDGDSPGVRLSFTDYGGGIPPEIRDRLFDPFFSTKPKGEGTGLGLSISHGLIRDHDGYIHVQSKLGEWTRFTIDIPIQ